MSARGGRAATDGALPPLSRMDVSNLTEKLAVVTGAASGIGKETALALGRAGADLAICDVDEAGLERTSEEIRQLGRTVLSRRVDVSKRDDVEAFASAVHEGHDAVDILVNNAGVGVGGGFLDTPLEDWEWVVGINLWGVIHGCRAFVPNMVKRGQGGHVVNVASAAGYVASEALVAYATTKFGVVGLSEGLRDELRKHGIGVTAVCPGIINTPITRTSRLRGRVATDEARRKTVELYERRNYGPERVAAKILKAIARNAAVAPITPEAWTLWILKRLSPGLVTWLNRKMAERFERELEQASRS